MNKKNIFKIFEENQEYETCNIEFEPLGGAEDGVDFRPVLDMQNQNIRLREKLEILIAFTNGEWQDCETICNILGIEFRTGLGMFDFSRTAEWNPAPLNGQKITTKFRPKELELRSRVKELELNVMDLVHQLQAKKYYQDDLHREMINMLLNNIEEECRKKLVKLVAEYFASKLYDIYKNLDDKGSVSVVGLRNSIDFVKAEIEKLPARDFYREVVEANEKKDK